MVNPKDIDPFAYQKSTNIAEHNQIVDKINELVDGNNDLNDKVPTAINQSFDDESRILATTLTTVDGTEISGSVYVPGGGDGGDIVVSKMLYADTIPNIIEDILTKYGTGDYNCNIEIQCHTKTTASPITMNATKMSIQYSGTSKFIGFSGSGSAVNGPVNGVTFTKVIDDTVTYDASVSIYSSAIQDWVDVNLDTTVINDIDGFVIKGIKGAAITPYTASTGIKIDDENSTIAVDTDVIATVDSVKEVDTKADTAKTTADTAITNAETAKTTADTAITNADTANTNALKAYKSAYVENNTMTFEKGNGDTDTIALPTGGSYTAGEGITISDNEIAVDTSTIATTAVTTELASGISTNRNLINGAYCDVGITDNVMTFTAVDGQQKEITIPSGGETTNVSEIYITPINYSLTISEVATKSTWPQYTNGVIEYGTGIGVITGYGMVVKSSNGAAYYSTTINLSNTFTDYLDKLITIKTNITSGTLRLGVSFARLVSDLEFTVGVSDTATEYLYYDIATKTYTFTSKYNHLYVAGNYATSQYISLILREVAYIA